MYKLSRLKKRVRGIAIGLAASGMVIGNVASVAALTASSLSMSDQRINETAVTYTHSASSYDTGTTLNCISLDFNDQADGLGSVPAGMTTTGATLDASGTLITEASWTESFASNGALDLTFVAGEAPATSGSLVFTGMTNGSTTGTTYFALISTYTNTDCSTGLTDSSVVAFVFTEGTSVSLTIEPTLTFTVVGVAASQAVNSATTTHLSTATAIDYLNDVTASTNGVSAHDLQVSTNATGGWTVSIRQSAQLTNLASDTIDNHTGTNLSPTALAAGTERWGYTTEDATLTLVGDGVDRFTNPGNEWAGFTTSNEEVVYNAGPSVGTETTRVGHQVAVASDTEAGVYTSTIIYTVVATF